MGSGTPDFPSRINTHEAANHSQLYVTCGAVIFIGTIMLLAGGGMPFFGKDQFLTFLSAWFMLIATVAFGQAREYFGMLIMASMSLLVALACIISLIVT